MIRLIRAESRKLTALLLIAVGGLALVSSVALAAVEQDWAKNQLRILDRNMSTPAAVCPPGPDAEACQEMLAMRSEADSQFIRTMTESIQPIAAQQTPAGSFSFVAGLMMTSGGAIIAFLLAAALVGGEWQRGTASPMFLAEHRLFRIALAKISVIAGLSLLVTVIAWAAVYVFGQAYFPMAAHSGAVEASPANAFRRFGLLLGMTIIWSALAVLAGLLMRNRLGTLVLGALLLGILNLGSSIGGLEAYTPFGVLADIVPLGDAYAAWDYLMVRPEPGLQMGGATMAPDPAVGNRMLVFAPLLLVVGAGLAWLRRMDLVE
jgi:ABC-type transport system involved in multi-copper enzyme maturation permease subunit